MGNSHQIKFVAALAVAGATLSLSSTALAGGRCGHSYAVDKQTTLVEVARQCNVNLSALYEANPGVNPSNVRPGEHLSVPDEIDRYTNNAPVSSGSNNSGDSATTVTQTEEPGSNQTTIVSAGPGSSSVGSSIDDDFGHGDYDRDRVAIARVSQRIRVRDRRISSHDTPNYIRRGQSNRSSISRASTRLGSMADRLSFQQLSAMRIQTAGQAQSNVRFASLNTTLKPETRLIECATLRNPNGGKIHKVNSIISTPDKTYVEISAAPGEGGFDCRLVNGEAASVENSAPAESTVPPARFINNDGRPLDIRSGDYRLPDYSKIGTVSRNSGASLSTETISLSGDVIASVNGCLVLETADKSQWRLAATPPSGDLLGKQVTVWGVPSHAGACGAGPAMTVSHAVYAEPIN